MPWHHVIPKHEWKVRFGNFNGFNSHDNLVNLTTEQHSHVHLLLYEINQIEYDRIASLTIAGAIGKEEAHRLANYHAHAGNKHHLGFRNTEQWKREQSERLTGNKNALGHKPTPEFYIIDSNAQKNSLICVARWKKVISTLLTCSRCGKIGNPGNMTRWHFNNCKVRA